MADQRTVTISIPPALAREVDRLARKEGRTRSELLREAFRQYATRVGRWERVFELGRDIAARRGLSDADVDRVVKEERRASGDRDVLDLGRYEAAAIVTPKDLVLIVDRDSKSS